MSLIIFNHANVLIFLLIFILKTIEVTIPEIEAMRLAHYVTIGSECSTSIARELENL